VRYSRKISFEKIHFFLVLQYFPIHMIHKKCNIGLNQPTMHVVQLIVVIIVLLPKIVLTIRKARHTILQLRKIHQQKTNHRTFKFAVCNNGDESKLNIPNVSLHFISPKEKKTRQDKKTHTLYRT
jgi:hypothetical protein